MKLTNYRIAYLHPSLLDGTAQAVSSPPGFFQHELVVVAARERDALLQVQELGGTVISIKAVTQEQRFRGSNRGVSRRYKHKFLQGVSFNVRAGLSPEKALEEVILNEVGAQRPALNNVLEALRQGLGFVESLELLRWFDVSTMAVLRAGEASGRLGQALAIAVTFYEKSSALIKLMFGAFMWTLLDLFMAISTVAGIRFGLIEQLKETSIVTDDASKIEEFHYFLKLAENINDGLLIFAFLATVVILYLVALVISPDKKTREQGYFLLERTPIICDVLKSGALASTCRVMSSLMRGGVLFLDGLNIVKKGTYSPGVFKFWQRVESETEAGVPPSQAFNQLILEGSERLLLRTHRDQKQLAEALESIADSREEQATAAAKTFSVAAFMISLAYSGIAVLTSLFVVYLQNQAVMSGAG